MKPKEILDLVNNDKNIKTSIGTKQEKTIHQFLKYFISNNSQYHEVKINRHIVDVLIDNHIYEIQTRSFNAFKSKLKTLLDDYLITVVYPIAQNKMLYKVNEQGEIIQVRKSPKKTHPLSIGEELYKIKDLLKHENLSFKIVLLDVDEYNTTRISRRKQLRLSKIDQYPKDIINVFDINSVNDWINLFPNLENFTTKSFMKETKLSLKQAGHALNVFRYLDVIEVTGKIGNAYVYNLRKKVYTNV